MSLSNIVNFFYSYKKPIKVGAHHRFSCLILSVILVMFSNVALSDIPNTLPETLNTVTDAALLNNTNTPEYVVIQPSDVVTFSSENSASIAEMNVKEGSQFKKGDILLEMDCRLPIAEYEKAYAQFASADIAYKSALKLKSFGSISELESVKAKSDAAIAKADVDKLKTLVEKCTITAPFNGAVSEIMVHVLETVKPGDPLLKIVNTENLEFEIQVPSRWLQWLKIGTVFHVKINETNKTVTAAVTRIDPQIESISQTIKITGQITPQDKSLLPGMSGQASFPENPESKTHKTNDTQTVGKTTSG